MARRIVFTPKAAKPPATYSQAVKAAGLVFVSGTAPTDPETGAIKGSTIQLNGQADQRDRRAGGRGRLRRDERRMAQMVS